MAVTGGIAFIVAGVVILVLAGFMGRSGSRFIGTMINNSTEFWTRRGLYSHNPWTGKPAMERERTILTMRIGFAGFLVIFGVVFVVAGILRVR